MRVLFTCLLVFGGIWVSAQRHSIALSGGANYITSFIDENPIAIGSPFESKIGLKISLEYSYVLENHFFFNVRSNYSQLGFTDKNALGFTSSNSQSINALDLTHYYFSNSLGVGYQFDISKHYSLGIDAGGSMFYYFKSVSESDQIANSRNEIDRGWDSEDLFYGLYLENNHYFNIYRSREIDFNLLAGLRATTVFNYLNFDNSPRLLLELFLGVEVQLK